ncbi:hypothetical protein Enr13x_40370 [Stieleria neptunia]|uniref:Uncharacterized protein n=1 Tax=Stieleria neptunia TaxID=2527979 RepID=A0A518HTI3_9BACT|nr:hypothetical protein Enr13x_40370 [Stieleria neptunia]
MDFVESYPVQTTPMRQGFTKDRVFCQKREAKNDASRNVRPETSGQCELRCYGFTTGLLRNSRWARCKNCIASIGVIEFRSRRCT